MTSPVGTYPYGPYGPGGGMPPSSIYAPYGPTGFTQYAPLESTPLTPFEHVRGENFQLKAEHSGGIQGALVGAAIGAVTGFLVSGLNPVGALVGAIGGGTAGTFAGGEFSKYKAVVDNVDQTGKLDGNMPDEPYNDRRFVGGGNFIS